MKYFLQLFAATILILIGKYYYHDGLTPHFIAGGFIIITTLLVVDFGYFAYIHWGRFKFMWQTKILYGKTSIRLSISYLFRIQVDGKYLLVKSRTRKYFQPVGGAFKALPGSEAIFERLNVRPDRLIETKNGIAKNDLRVYVEGKNVVPFLEWFKSKTDREISPWGEFCEELISPGILEWRPFRYIDYKYKGTVQTPIINLTAGGKGIYLFEIYDLVVNDEQMLLLKALKEKGNAESYIWVEDYYINSLGHDEKKKAYIYDIAPHTKWAYDLKWSNI